MTNEIVKLSLERLPAVPYNELPRWFDPIQALKAIGTELGIAEDENGEQYAEDMLLLAGLDSEPESADAATRVCFCAMQYFFGHCKLVPDPHEYRLELIRVIFSMFDTTVGEVQNVAVH